MIVTLVSVDRGKITATARGCLKPRAKLRYAASPFNFGEYVLNGKDGRYIITECSQIDSFSEITSDIERYYIGCALLDALDRLSREPSPSIFTLTLSKLGELAYDFEKEADVIFTEFVLDTLKASGVGLDFAHCNVCGCNLEGEAYFSEKDGIVCKHCRDFGSIAIDGLVRAYLAGESAPKGVRVRANVLLANILNQTSGVKIDTRYFMEQL